MHFFLPYMPGKENVFFRATSDNKGLYHFAHEHRAAEPTNI